MGVDLPNYAYYAAHAISDRHICESKLCYPQYDTGKPVSIEYYETYLEIYSMDNGDNENKDQNSDPPALLLDIDSGIDEVSFYFDHIQKKGNKRIVIVIIIYKEGLLHHLTFDEHSVKRLRWRKPSTDVFISDISEKFGIDKNELLEGLKQYYAVVERYNNKADKLTLVGFLYAIIFFIWYGFTFGNELEYFEYNIQTLLMFLPGAILLTFTGFRLQKKYEKEFEMSIENLSIASEKEYLAKGYGAI